MSCVGALSYVQQHNRASVLSEFLRVVRPGGVASFSHRTDYVEAQGWGEIQRALVAAGRWTLLHRSAELDNLPESTAHGSSTLTHFAYRVS